MASWIESFAGKNPFILTRQLRLKGGVRIATLAGAETWDATTAHLQFLDCGGSARTITLPAAAAVPGLALIVVNTSDAAETITVTGQASIPQNTAAIYASNGTAWDSAAFTISLT
jgi:hypothetical protein